MEYGNMLLSRILDDNDVAALRRHNVRESDLQTAGEKETLRFIVEYAEQNGGQAPDYRTAVAECPQFVYYPQVEDSYEYLTKQIKSYAAKVQFADLIQTEVPKIFDASDGFKTIDETIERLLAIKNGTEIRSNLGRTFSDIRDSFKSEYLKREEGKSFKCWQTPFESLTKEIGGWYSGDVYGIMAESGRGKTYLNVKIVDSLLRQGANVLVKSFEVKEYVWIARLISVATAVDEMLIDEIGRKVGLPNKRILSGKLEDVVREQFLAVVDALDSYYPGKLYFQGKSGGELTRTLDDLERELMTGVVNAVVIDPFYGLSDVYGKNANKTAGGAAEWAATRFEQIIGDNDVVGFYTVQATVERKQTDEEDRRELNLPKRDQVKTTKRLLDIATNLISFDSLEKDGRAMLGIEKGRNGGEDFTLELMAIFDYGVLAEFPTGAVAASQFNF